MKIIILSICFLLFNSCAWLDSSEDIQLINGYSVSWYDLESNRNLNRDIESVSKEICNQPLITDYIYAVGFDSTYIILKTHPNHDTSRIDFYIVNTLYKEHSGANEVYGPLREKEFIYHSIRFGIDTIKFTLKFNEIPSDFN